MNQRCFVLGNGPSLADTPLDRLVDETTFALNRVNLIYPVTKWRPTYYVGFDFTGEGMLQDIEANLAVCQHAFIRADRANDIEVRRNCFDWPPKITYTQVCTWHRNLDYNPDDPARMRRVPRRWHLPTLCPFGSTLNIAVQIAVVMGFTQIFLLGCDLGFRPYTTGRPDLNHFHPRYIGHDDNPLSRKDQTLAYMHEMIERETQARGVKVYNASLGGVLEAHERINLYDVLER